MWDKWANPSLRKLWQVTCKLCVNVNRLPFVEMATVD
jgi:hypothetical protein